MSHHLKLIYVCIFKIHFLNILLYVVCNLCVTYICSCVNGEQIFSDIHSRENTGNVFQVSQVMIRGGTQVLCSNSLSVNDSRGNINFIKKKIHKYRIYFGIYKYRKQFGIYEYRIFTTK